MSILIYANKKGPRCVYMYVFTSCWQGPSRWKMTLIAKFMGPTWVLSAPGGPMLAIWTLLSRENTCVTSCFLIPLDDALPIWPRKTWNGICVKITCLDSSGWYTCTPTRVNIRRSGIKTSIGFSVMLGNLIIGDIWCWNRYIAGSYFGSI